MRFAALLLCFTVCGVAQDIRATSSVPKLVFPNGGRVSWGAKNNLLAFDQLGTNGYYDVFTSNPDGSNVVCLTCSATLPAYNKGNPEWDPTNDYLAVQIQTTPVDSSAFDASFYTPGSGVGNDLYIADAAGKNYWAVTSGAKGILHPRFSHDGTKLLWVQRTFANFWNLMLGDYAVINGVPQVTNIQSLPPCAGDVFCETGGFSYDDSAVYFTSNLDGQQSTGIDIYSYNLTTGKLVNLTNSPDNWDEFPTSFPSSDRILWMSGTYTDSGLKTDYWTMNSDGSNKVQLTYYNDPDAPSWLFPDPVSCAKFSWSPDGSQLAGYFIPFGRAVGQDGSIYEIPVETAAPTLSAASYARPPLTADSIASTFYPDMTGTTVSVTDAQGVARVAPVFFSATGQVNWELPTDTSVGPATVQLTNSQGAVVRATVNVLTAAPGLFTITASGSGAPAGYLLTFPAQSSQNLYDCSSGACLPAAVNLGSSSDSAYVVLFATGVRHANSVIANIAGEVLPVSYFGAQGSYTGLDQINVLLPHSLSGSGTVTLTITADGVTSNAVTLQLQ